MIGINIRRCILFYTNLYTYLPSQKILQEELQNR